MALQLRRYDLRILTCSHFISSRFMFTNKLQERRRLSPPRRQGSSSPPHYKNVGIYDPKTSRFLFTYKLQERRHLRSQDSKVPVHLRITRTSLLDTATIVSSCSRVVSACACFAWGRSIALCQKKKKFWADLWFIHMRFIYITFRFYYCSTMLLHSLFRMGESNYLFDNLMQKALSERKKIGYIFLFFFWRK